MSPRQSKVVMGVRYVTTFSDVNRARPRQGKMGEKHFEEFEPERLVKSTERVRDLGEVYTPSNIVDDMLDLLPDHIWDVHPSPTFLEPSVGNGNFVSAILSRKLTLIDQHLKSDSLPAGSTEAAAEFHALEALSSIYGVDISEDNIIGGTPGHEVACRPRLLTILKRWHEALTGKRVSEKSAFMKSARWIVEHNMIVGNMLARDSDGNATGRESLPLIDYEWNAKESKVTLLKTTLGAVLEEAAEQQSEVLSLFGPEPAEKVWAGSANSLHLAKTFSTVELTGRKISNSRGGNK